MMENLSENSADEQQSTHHQNNEHQPEQNGNEHHHQQQQQHHLPPDPISRNNNNGSDSISTPTTSKNASSIASTASKINKKSRSVHFQRSALKIKKSSVEKMREDLREMMLETTPALPKASSSTSSSSTHQQQQHQQKDKQQIGEEEILMSLKCLVENLRSKKEKQVAKVEGEYNVVCRLRNFKSNDEGIQVQHTDGPFNDVDKPYAENRMNLIAHAELKKCSYEIEKIWPPSPLNMISLMQICYEDPSLMLEPIETMKIAMELHKNGFITNPRTMATAFAKGFPSDDRIKTVIRQMDEICGSEGRIDVKSYLNHMRKWGSTNGQQNANGVMVEPIQPNLLEELNLDGKSRTLEGKERAMYLLICRHFLAVFHLPDTINNYKFSFKIGLENFKYECQILETCNLCKIYPRLKPIGSLKEMPNDLREKIRKFQYNVSGVQKCPIAIEHGHCGGITLSQFIGLLAQNVCSVQQIPEMFRKLKEKKLINKFGQLITPSGALGMEKIPKNVTNLADTDDRNDGMDDDVVENSNEQDSIIDAANSFMREQRRVRAESDFDDEESRSRHHRNSSSRNRINLLTMASPDWRARARTMPLSVSHNRLKNIPQEPLPAESDENLYRYSNSSRSGRSTPRQVQYDQLPRRSRSREEIVTTQYNRANASTTFVPRRPYQLRSGGRIENTNGEAEQNGNRRAINVHHNQNAFDPRYKTAMCKYWLASQSCPLGAQCNFAHGENEHRSFAPFAGRKDRNQRMPTNRKRQLEDFVLVDDYFGNWRSRWNEGTGENGHQFNVGHQHREQPNRENHPSPNWRHLPQNLQSPPMPLNQQQPMLPPYQPQQQQGPMSRSRARARAQDLDYQNGNGMPYGGQNGNGTLYKGQRRINVTPLRQNTQWNSQQRNLTPRMSVPQQLHRTAQHPNARPAPSNAYSASTHQIGPKRYKAAFPAQNDPSRQQMAAPRFGQAIHNWQNEGPYFPLN